MKRYISVKIKKIFELNRYVFDKGSGQESNKLLWTLFWALDEFYHKDVFIQFLNNPKAEDESAINYGFMEKSKNMVKIYNSFDDLDSGPGKDPIPSAVISIENLKEITRDWKKLYGSKRPVIYLILQDDGWIIVRESLENDQD